MLDPLIRRYASRLLAAPTVRIQALGASRVMLTVAGFMVGVAAVPAIARHAYFFGLVLIAAGRLADAAASAVTLPKPPEPFGVYLRQVLDMTWTASVPFAFALAQPDRALAAMFLMLGLTARAAALTSDAKLPGRLVDAVGFGAGLIGKFEIFVAFALACIFPDWFSIVAYGLGMLCFVMTGFRVALAGQHRP